MRSFLLLLGVTLTTACGSQVDTAVAATSGGGGSGGAATTGTGGTTATGGAGGAACDPGNDPGAVCAPSVQCVTPHAFCSCDPSNPGCHDPQTGQTVALHPPPLPPPDGACCVDEGMVCGGFSECGPLCHCENGAWSCATPIACPPFACPETPDALLQLQGQACPTEIGRECLGGSGCFYVDCRCTLDPATGQATWTCPATPC